LGLFVRNRTGDVEFACYESWVMAYKNNDRQGMMNAITHAIFFDNKNQNVIKYISND